MYSDILITHQFNADTFTAAYTLGISDAPGNPLYIFLGRLCALFSEPESFLTAMRALSIIAASTTIMLLYFSVVSIAKQILFNTQGIRNVHNHILLHAVGIISATSLLFSTSFWNSARTPGIDALSTLFVALLCWITIRWYNSRHRKQSNRFVILAVFILSLGISIEPYILLIIPALYTVFYSAKHPPSFNNSLIGFGYGIGISIGIWGIFFRILPFLAANIDIAANKYLSLPINAGMMILYVLIFGTLIYTMTRTFKKHKASHLIFILITMLFIGQLPYAYIIIRSEQTVFNYGETPDNAWDYAQYLSSSSKAPLLYGTYFNAPITEFSQEKKIIATDTGYVYTKPLTKPKYNSNFKSYFPRLWSTQKEHEPIYIKFGALRKGENTLSVYHEGISYNKPTLWQHVRFFWSYQLSHMYFRYVMWNFTGKQNNYVGNGEPHKGNWISGISLIDNIRLKPQDSLPQKYKHDSGHNTYFLLPLLLGLLGAGYVFKKHRIFFTLFAILFMCTGIIKVLIMNIAPTITYEIDNLYLNSYLAYSFFIGFGILAIFELGKDIAKKKRTYIAITCGLCSPIILYAQNYDDHTKANNSPYTSAQKLLHTSPANAIMFLKDNQLFETAQYLQTVGQNRKDVQLINWNYLDNPRYISELRSSQKNPLILSVPAKKYTYGVNDEIFVLTHSAPSKQYYPAQDILQILSSDNLEYKAKVSEHTYIDFIPSPLVCLPAQNVSSETYAYSRPINFTHTVCFSLIKQNDAGQFVDSIITKNQLVFLDIITHNNWEHPVCFSHEMNPSAYFNLDSRCISKGVYLQLFPIKKHTPQLLDVDFVYTEYVTKPLTENTKSPNEYLSILINLSRNLLYEKRFDSVRNVLSTQLHYFPTEEYPELSYSVAHASLFIQDSTRAFSLFSKISSTIQEYLLYYISLHKKDQKNNIAEIEQTLQLSIQLFETALEYDKPGIAYSLAESTTLCIEHIYDFTEQITISDPRVFIHKNQWTRSLSKKNMNIAYWYNKMKVYLRN
jgi:hypothetical protein